MPVEKDPPVATADYDASDCAIDDSDDGDELYVEIQKSISDLKKRRASGRVSLHDLPFRWSPLILPLTESNVNSCVVLEEAAFPNPDHRATREKVRLHVCGFLSYLCVSLLSIPLRRATMNFRIWPHFNSLLAQSWIWSPSSWGHVSALYMH